MVLVDRFAVEHRFDRGAGVVDARLVVAAGVLGDVAVLPHIEVEPLGVVEPGRRAVAAGRMQRHQVRSAVPGAQAPRHGLDDRALAVGLDRTVAADDPDDVGHILVAPAEPRAVAFGVRRREHLRARPALDVPLVAPGRQEPDVNAAAASFRDDEVDVIPVVVLGSVFHLGRRRVVTGQRPMSVRVRLVQSIQFCQRHGLNDGEAAGGAVGQVVHRFLPCEAMEELPRRIAKPEERLVVRGDEETFVVGHPQPRQRWRLLCRYG